MSAQILQNAAERIAGLMASRPEVQAAYIFGSTAAGRQRSNSDIDVAVLLDPEFVARMPIKYRTDLIADAGGVLETFDVDVIVLNHAPPALAYNVVTKGKLIYERSRSGRVAFQIRNLNQFLDLEPLHKLRLQYLKKRYQ